MKAIILAAGKCTRMGDLCLDTPKCMLPVLGKPILQWIIEFMSAQIHDFYIAVSYKQEKIVEYFGNGSKLGVSIHYYEVQNSKGTADSLNQLIEGLNLTQYALVTYADILMGKMDYLGTISDDGIQQIGINYIDDPYLGAAVYFDQKNQITEFVEKPKKGESLTFWNAAGVMWLNLEWFAEEYDHFCQHCDEGEELVLTQFLDFLMNHRGLIMKAHHVNFWWDMGTKDLYLQHKKKIEQHGSFEWSEVC